MGVLADGFIASFLIAIALDILLRVVWAIAKWALKRTLCREYFYTKKSHD